MTITNLDLYFAIQKLRDFGMQDHEIAHTLVMSMDKFNSFIKEFENE